MELETRIFNCINLNWITDIVEQLYMYIYLYKIRERKVIEFHISPT